jgi:hypothetical protein
LLKAYSRGGDMSDGKARSAKRVRRAIWRLLRGLKRATRSDGRPNETLRGFAEHLERYLCLPSIGARGRAVALLVGVAAGVVLAWLWVAACEWMEG